MPGRPAATRTTALATLSLLALVLALWSLTVGTTPMSLLDAIHSLAREATTREDIIIGTIRMPRVLAALFVGATLAVAGALMQAVTANPLASPDLLGVSAGAAFAVVVSIVLFDAQSSQAFIWYAFGGAAIAAVAVYAMGSVGRSGATPVKLALAGAVASVFLGSISMSMLIFDSKATDAIRMWSLGSLSGRDMAGVVAVAPYGILGLASAFLFAREVTTLSLGTEFARGLGQNVRLWRFWAAMTVVLLAGSAVALAGPIGFVGLVVPHMVRFGLGSDYRWILPFCAAGGALLVLLADTLQRWLTGIDVPVGVTMAIIGAPFFIWLARSRAGVRA